MELSRVTKIASIKRCLHVANVVNVLLGVDLQLLHVQLLCHDDASDIFCKAFVLWVLPSDNTLDIVHQCGFVLIVLDHTKTGERAQLEPYRLLVRVVHIITNVQDKTKHWHQTDGIAERL